MNAYVLRNGLVCGGLGLWAGVRAARRHRGVDERLKLAAVRGLAKGWGVTGLALGAALVWAGVGHPPVAQLAGLLFLVHFAGAAIMFVVHAARM
jgi:hypothetical protein